MINLPAELGWISKNLALGLALGPWGRFLLTQPRSAGRFTPVNQIKQYGSKEFSLNRPEGRFSLKGDIAVKKVFMYIVALFAEFSL